MTPLPVLRFLLIPTVRRSYTADSSQEQMLKERFDPGGPAAFLDNPVLLWRQVVPECHPNDAGRDKCIAMLDFKLRDKLSSSRKSSYLPVNAREVTRPSIRRFSYALAKITG
jgi:hypothetical protein